MSNPAPVSLIDVLTQSISIGLLCSFCSEYYPEAGEDFLVCPHCHEYKGMQVAYECIHCKNIVVKGEICECQWP